MTRSFLAPLALAWFLAAPAQAAPKAAYAVHGDTPSYEVAFDDEDLLASPSSAYGEWLKVRRRPPKVMLLRPRTSFVPELLTTVNGF
jgi:hypothetical protein